MRAVISSRDLVLSVSMTDFPSDMISRYILRIAAFCRQWCQLVKFGDILQEFIAFIALDNRICSGYALIGVRFQIRIEIANADQLLQFEHSIQIKLRALMGRNKYISDGTGGDQLSAIAAGYIDNHMIIFFGKTA